MSLPAISYADSGTCGVKQGATDIFEGMATDDKDITIWNDKMAVSFAVGSNNYWNMTKGSILDICAIDSSGKWGPDLVNDVELLMDLWTADRMSTREQTCEMTSRSHPRCHQIKKRLPLHQNTDTGWLILTRMV